jgi:hypothetical protein
MTDGKINSILLALWLALFTLAATVGWLSRGVAEDQRYLRAMAERDEAATKFYTKEFNLLVEKNQKLYRRDTNGHKSK